MSPVEYIKRTREFFAQQGFPPYRWTENADCPYWSPLKKPLEKCRVALLSTGGIYIKDEQIPFNPDRDDLTFREIVKKYGKDYFRNLETNVIRILNDMHLENTIIDTGGGSPMREENRKLLKSYGIVVYNSVDPDVNYDRIMANGIPAFFKYQDDPRRSFDELLVERGPIYTEAANIVLKLNNESLDEALEKLLELLKNEGFENC